MVGRAGSWLVGWRRPATLGGHPCSQLEPSPYPAGPVSQLLALTCCHPGHFAGVPWGCAW